MSFTGRNIIRKLTSVLVSALMVFAMCSCSANAGGAGSGKLKVVTTIFPEYDWVKQIAGSNLDNIELTLLCDNGVDMHSFQPTANDIIKISSCDVFVYVGGESDEWVEDALAEAVNKDMKVVNLMEILGSRVVEEEVVEGMEAEDEEEEAYDEHVWLSLKNAQILVTGIADAMGKADPANADTYKTNAESYNKQLASPDAKFEEAVKNAGKDTLLFGDRFPFRYLVYDYKLNYYAAFAGCSAETEASFETIVFLADKLDELGLKAVLTIDGGDQSIAKTIIENTASKDQDILVMDSMQSTTSKDSAQGVTYITIMEYNLATVARALA